MLEFVTKHSLKIYLDKKKSEKYKVGFVPTMGALHAGHVSLINESKRKTDITVCSIFVNPTQFNNDNDLRKYPNLINSDRKKLLRANCDVLFKPSVKNIYPNGKEYIDPANVGYLTNILEGEFRSGHFEGMMQVVEILLRSVEPHILYMGMKDYQQLAIVKKMVSSKSIDVEVIGLPIVREEDGLAMSSRNSRLSEIGRKQALSLYITLKEIANKLNSNNIDILQNEAFKMLDNTEGVKTEYFRIVDRNTLLTPEDKTTKTNLVALCAAWVDGVRLIDNMELNL